MYSAFMSHVTPGTDHTDCNVQANAWGHRMKCQVSVGVKLSRRALVLPQQDGEHWQSRG